MIDSNFKLIKLIGGPQTEFVVQYQINLCPTKALKVPFITNMATKHQTVAISDRCICSEGCGYFSQGHFYGIENGIYGNLSQTEQLQVSRIESCPSLMLGISDNLNYYGYVEILRDPGMR